MEILKRETVTKTYNKYCTITQESKEYHYDTKEARDLHSIKMQKEGWNDSGQVCDNVGTVMNPIYVPYAIYYKEKMEENR